MKDKKAILEEKAVLVDIDGTAAIMWNNRGPFDYDMVGYDSMNYLVWVTIKGLEEQGYQIVFCSGRENVTFPGRSKDKVFRRAYMPAPYDTTIEFPNCYELTHEWLHQNVKLLGMNAYYNPILYMRAEGDHRPDWIVKKELFLNEISKKYNIELVIDDRQQVVDMWRSLGLTCFQVAEGNF